MGLSLKLGFNSSGAGIESQTEIESQAGIESQIDWKLSVCLGLESSQGHPALWGILWE